MEFLFFKNSRSDFTKKNHSKTDNRLTFLLRKEVIQPHLPVQLPCYDFTPLAKPTLNSCLLCRLASTIFRYSQLGWCDGRCVQGPGTYSPQLSDLRLLAIPASCRRVSACNLNWGGCLGFTWHRYLVPRCFPHCSACVAQVIKGMMI